MAFIYRLEFNEKQQKFHLDNKTHKENTHGWITISENCTDLEFKIFECFVNRTKKSKLTKNYVIKSLQECKKFVINLLEYGVKISSN